MRKPESRLAQATTLPETPSLSTHDLRIGLLLETRNESHAGGLGSLLGWRRANRGGHEKTAKDGVLRTTEPKTSERETTEMIDEIFEPLKPAQEKLTELAKRLEPLTRVRSLAEAFAPIRAFKDKLASVVEPIRKLEQDFEQLADVFQPIGHFRDELAGFTGEFASKLTELTQVLGPLGKLREELAALTAALEPATELHDDFTKLSAAIATAAHERGPNKPEKSDAQDTWRVA